MKYYIKRFSMKEAITEGNQYLSAQLDSGIGKIEDLSTDIVENPKLKDLKPVKKWGRFTRNIAKLLRKEKKKEYSTVDPTSTLNTAEANKFKIAMNRLSNQMGSSTQDSILK